MITIFSAPYEVRLPWALSWSVSNPRQQVTRVALAGNEVQQYAAKSTSAGTAQYQADVDTDDADNLDALQMASGECVVSDGSSAWVATIDAKLSPTNSPGKTNVAISFRVIRKIA